MCSRRRDSIQIRYCDDFAKFFISWLTKNQKNANDKDQIWMNRYGITLSINNEMVAIFLHNQSISVGQANGIQIVALTKVKKEQKKAHTTFNLFAQKNK